MNQVSVHLEGEIADRFSEFKVMCEITGKDVNQRISELALGDLLLWQRLGQQ